MVEAIADYDIIVHSIRDADTIQSVYIAELGQYADVAFIDKDLYIAEDANNERHWYLVGRKPLTVAHAPLAPPKSYHGTTCSNLAEIVSGCRALPIGCTPEIYSLLSPYTPDTGSFLVEPFNAYPSVDKRMFSCVNDAKQDIEANCGGLVPQPVTASKTGGRKYKRRFVCPETGESVPMSTPGAVCASSFRNRKSVNPDTGEFVPVGTQGAVTAACYESRKPVDPRSGKPVPRDTPGAVASSVFRNSRLVDPLTGALVPQNTVGAITRAIFYRRRYLRRKKDGIYREIAAKKYGNI
ncbi:MAG: hypothetical protein EOO38_11290 [Cytophagaceae bacterium]|nr:MAG: hypothetical protein EOO38_11290 [Cytophagaceae bacterium]